MQGGGQKPGEGARVPSEKVEPPSFPDRRGDSPPFFSVPYFLLVEDMDNGVKEASPLGRGHWRRKRIVVRKKTPTPFLPCCAVKLVVLDEEGKCGVMECSKK